MGNIGGVILGGVLLVVLPEALRNGAGPAQQWLLGRTLIDPESLRLLFFGIAADRVMLWPPPVYAVQRAPPETGSRGWCCTTGTRIRCMTPNISPHLLPALGVGKHFGG